MDRAPGGPLLWRCVRRTAPRQRLAQASAAVRIGCHTSNRDAQAMRARQHVRTSCHELREAARGSGCNAHRRVARCWFLKCERMPTRSSRRRRVRLEGETCRGSTFASEPRPRACTPGAMDARNWSRLMCLETQGTRGGGPALVLDGMAEGLTHNQLGSTYVSDVTRWACRWRRSASRCIPDGRSGRNVGVGHWASQ